MKPLDDLLAEERDPQYAELITLLQQANHSPMLVDPTQRAQLLSRVRARLTQTDLGVSLTEAMPLPADGGPASSPSKPEAPAGTQRPSRQFVRLLNALAAVLIVGALVGAMLLLLASHRSELGARGVAEKGCSFTSTTGIVHGYNDLSAVTALSRNDIWVVGENMINRIGLPLQASHALLEHWNGSQWCGRPDPYPITGTAVKESVNLRALAAASTNDVWAVGDVDAVGGEHALIEHWDGSRWSVTPNPANGGSLSGVAAISPTDAWAVGSYFTGTSSGNRALIEHWNGKQWSIIPNPAPISSYFSGITALSANDVWAVGDTPNSATLIVHWDGKRWSVVPSPNPGHLAPNGYNLLSSVAAVSANDVWAVGDFVPIPTHTPVATLALHWNGSRWSVVSSPSPSIGGNGNDLVSVAARSANDVWAVGISGNALIEHWDGSRWSVVQGAGQELSAVAIVPHSTTIVAVGSGSLLYFKDPDGESLSKP